MKTNINVRINGKIKALQKRLEIDAYFVSSVIALLFYLCYLMMKNKNFGQHWCK